jgi:hypothetical protein
VQRRHSGEFASRDASVRPMPSASAMSVRVAPAARAFAIDVRRPSRRSSTVGAGCVLVAGLRLFTPSRWDEPPVGRYSD